VVIVETERVVVRSLVGADLDAFAAVTGDPELMRYVGDGTTLSREETAGWIDVTARNQLRDGWTTWAVADRTTGALIGYAGLVHGDEDAIEVTYVLGRDSWGRGLAGEIVAALVEHAFTVRGLTELRATIDPRNTASRRVVEKAGFRAVAERTDPHGQPEILYVLRTGPGPF
jgi:[ribosomal protein S5]-alanine N-acetyltransferase